MVMVMLVGVCWGWGEETKERVNVAAENAKIKAEEIKHGAVEAMQGSEDKTQDSWSDYGFDKLPE